MENNDIIITTPQEEKPRLDLYEHGLTNGILKVPKENFEAYIRETQLQKQNLAELEAIQISLEQKEREWQQLQNKTLELKTQVIDNEAKVSVEQEQLKRLNADNAAAQEQFKQQSNERSSLAPPYSWVPAVLYLLAGIVFITADVSITHDIVSWGLDMQGAEAWIFAVGLAALAFLVKPAIDRIVEKPYRTGANVKINHAVLVGLCVAAMVTLGILGYFRGQADKLKNNKLQLNNTKNQLLEKQNREPVAAERFKLEQQIVAVEKQIQELQGQLIDNWARVASFVLSSVLFAFAGAVCLGIAFPAIDMLFRKQVVLPRNLRRISAKQQQIREALQQSEQEVAQHKAQAQRAQVELSLLPSPEELKGDIKELKISQEQAEANIYAHKSASETGYYSDGYEQGKSFAVEGSLGYPAADLKERVFKNAVASQTQNGENGSKTAQNMPTLRPHLMLRQHITSNFNEKNK